MSYFKDRVEYINAIRSYHSEEWVAGFIEGARWVESQEGRTEKLNLNQKPATVSRHQ